MRLGTADIVWKKALRALRNRCRARLSDQLQGDSEKLELLSAILAVVALRIVTNAKALDRFELDRLNLDLIAPVEDMARELFEQLWTAIPVTLQNSLPMPSKDAIGKASELLANDERFDCLWQDVGTLGYVYQIWGHSFRDVALDAVQSPNKELSRQTLISFTQVYTPPWVIEYLLNETLIPILAEQKTAKGIRLLDPACGAGHFLLAAFDILKTHYATEGIAAKDFIPIILEQNLHGADIDPIGLSVCALSLSLKAAVESTTPTKAKMNLDVTDLDSFKEQVLPLGSIDPSWLTASDHFLSHPFDVVVTNPPYLGRRLLSRFLKDALGKEFPLSKSDLSNAFIEGSLRFIKGDGRFGAITQASLLVLPSYMDFRKQLERNADVLVAMPCGTGVFPLLSGEKADSLLLVLQKNDAVERARRPFAFNKAEKLAPVLDHAASTKLSELAEIRQGLATTNNRRFVRYRWEVEEESIGTDWVPYLKGAGSERWAAANDHVVRWKNSGEEIKRAVSEAYPYLQGKTAWVVKNERFYFKKGLCFSFINKSRLAVRELPPDFIFDVASSAIFAPDEHQDFLFGYLNSSIASAFANSLNPTINLQVGDLKRIPVPQLSLVVQERIAALSRHCVMTKGKLLELFEPINSAHHGNVQGTTLEAFSDLSLRFEAACADLKNSETELDRVVFENAASAFSFDASLKKALEPVVDSVSPLTQKVRKSLAAKFIHAWAGRLLSGNELEYPQIIKEGFFARKGADGLSIFFSPEDLDRLEEDLGVSLARYFDKRKVLDLARGFRGPSRYLSIKLPVSQATVLLSAKAIKTFARTETIGSNSFSSAGNEFDLVSLNGLEAASQECTAILKKVLLALNKIENWCTQDLISQLDAN